MNHMMQDACVDYSEVGSRNRQIVSLSIPEFDALPREIALPSPHFVCLLCCDARGVSDRAIIDTASALLDQGLVYLCTWGPGCNRVRNLFESAALVWDPKVALLTVHFYEGLDDALDYFLNVASPSMEYLGTCGTGLVVTVGANDWDRRVDQHLRHAHRV
jgi:hypothetical protein